MRAAIYTRVSTEQQERQQIIDSQIATLRAWVQEVGHELRPEHAFSDEGYSGARLDRPGLDALRDAVSDAEIDVVAVLSPDRLARPPCAQLCLSYRPQEVLIGDRDGPVGRGCDRPGAGIMAAVPLATGRAPACWRWPMPWTG